MIHPFDIQAIPVNWHSFFKFTGEIAMLIFLLGYCRGKLPRAHWSGGIVLVLFFLSAGLAGARLFSLFDIALSRGRMPDWSLFWIAPRFGALRWYGSMLFYAALLPLIIRGIAPAHRWKCFDLFGLSTCLFIVFLKQGCQFSGDGCYGRPTTLPWGMYYEWGEMPSLLPVHPTPVYDSLFHLLFFLYLVRRWKRGAPDGQTGLLFFAGSAAFCFLLEFIRINPPVALGLTLAQWTYLAILPVCRVTWKYLLPQKVSVHVSAPVAALAARRKPRANSTVNLHF